MAINFIKNIFEKNVDEETHHAFTRYSIGTFIKEPLLVTVTKTVKVQAGFEYVNVLGRLFARLAQEPITVKGAIPTTQDITQALKDAGGLTFEKKRRFGKQGTLYVVEGVIEPDKAETVYDQLVGCYALLDLTTTNMKLKMKKKETPKIGSPTDKFATLTLPKEHLDTVKQEFLFDHTEKDFKKAEIVHTYLIEDVVADEQLVAEDPARARLEAKRKGVLKRSVTLDGKTFTTETRFAV